MCPRRPATLRRIASPARAAARAGRRAAPAPGCPAAHAVAERLPGLVQRCAPVHADDVAARLALEGQQVAGALPKWISGRRRLEPAVIVRTWQDELAVVRGVQGPTRSRTAAAPAPGADWASRNSLTSAPAGPPGGASRGSSYISRLVSVNRCGAPLDGVAREGEGRTGEPDQRMAQAGPAGRSGCAQDLASPSADRPAAGARCPPASAAAFDNRAFALLEIEGQAHRASGRSSRRRVSPRRPPGQYGCRSPRRPARSGRGSTGSASHAGAILAHVAAAWRMNHTGVASTGSQRHARRKRPSQPPADCRSLTSIVVLSTRDRPIGFLPAGALSPLRRSR